MLLLGMLDGKCKYYINRVHCQNLFG